MTNQKNNGLAYVPLAEIDRIRDAVSDPKVNVKVLADLFRLNTLYMIANAGSGHIGTSLSAVDLMTWLWSEGMKRPNELQDRNADLFFSSKGHDAPALYAVLAGLHKIDFDLIHKLRRLYGAPGHPDIGTSYIIANTGSLGMGISKARGMAIARRLSGKSGAIYVLTGDGELQEGQFWESLQPTANGGFGEITVIVDANKIQSDTWVRDVSDLGDLPSKLRAFGWIVEEVNGHDLEDVRTVFTRLRLEGTRPKIIIAHTIKGRGVSFMEGGHGMDADRQYKYHGGALTLEEFQMALIEICDRVNSTLGGLGIGTIRLEHVPAPVHSVLLDADNQITAYADELARLGREREDLVVLDADLITSSGLVPFSREFPERFIECGIAEQDMVSVAGGLALQGKLPVCHSLECFLAARPNEQIYNNASERTRVIYTASLGGLLPGGTGHSHQGVRSIASLGAIPGLVLIQPSCATETRKALRWAVYQSPGSTFLRLSSVPLKLAYELPSDHVFSLGRGSFLRRGEDGVIIAYGPVMLTEAFKVAEMFDRRGFALSVLNFPWLNRVDEFWFRREVFESYPRVYCIDDHYRDIGLGTLVADTLARSLIRSASFMSFGISDSFPACGTNAEVLRHHGLDAASIFARIEADVVRSS